MGKGRDRLSNMFDSVKIVLEEVKQLCWWIWNEMLKHDQRWKTKQTKKEEATINSRENNELLETSEHDLLLAQQMTFTQCKDWIWISYTIFVTHLYWDEGKRRIWGGRVILIIHNRKNTEKSLSDTPRIVSINVLFRNMEINTSNGKKKVKELLQETEWGWAEVKDTAVFVVSCDIQFLPSPCTFPMFLRIRRTILRPNYPLTV